MKIVVLVKQVPNTSEIKIDKTTNTLIRAGVPSIINPDDLAGVEEALRLKKRYGGEVITVTMGPPSARDMLYELFGYGVDKGYLLSDSKFAGSDTYSTSTILSSFLKTIEYDLLIAGYQALDGDTAQVGPQVAEMLDIPQISHVNAVLGVESDMLQVEKAFEDEVVRYEVKLPTLITTIKTMNKVRYMNAYDIYKLDQKELVVVTSHDFAVDASKIGLKGSPTKVSKTATKEVFKKTEKEALTSDEAAERIFNLVKPYVGGRA